MKKIILPIAIATCALAAQFAPAAPPPDVKEIMSKPLTDIPGKEGLVLTGTYPPGGGDEIHRHDAHAFVYVLEGSIVMQLRGAEPVAVKAGEGFYEGPNDVHIVGPQRERQTGEVCRVSGEKPGCSGTTSGQVTQVAFLAAHDGRRLQPFCSSGRTAKTATVPPVTVVLIRARKVPDTLSAKYSTSVFAAEMNSCG